MKEIVIISGKGGTGKTSLAASFAVLAGDSAVIADCDVDAADMHLLLSPDHAVRNDFFSGIIARVDPENCTGCMECQAVCRFDSITLDGDVAVIDPIRCEGCGYCTLVCPTRTIESIPALAGEWYISTIRTGSVMVHAKLGIGADNSGKLVAWVKNEARRIAGEKGKELIIVDGSPGIGCPVISSLTGANYVLLVTEPSVTALHDLKRVIELTRNFSIPMGAVINKYDINPPVSDRIEKFLGEEKIPLLARIKWNEEFVHSIVAGRTIAETEHTSLSEEIRECWGKVMKEVVGNERSS